MYKAQLTDGEQIECEEYERQDAGIELYDGSGEFLAFVPYPNLLWVGNVDDDGKTRW
ncbi:MULTISPECIES: hypothetical protein [Halorussus]|uniref:hypothetical protein n=1 Tax=Halorussus TaxID=1070314 RepID=UPI00209E1D54|nr:hypothetical protein [Halorussus vallis]USZ77968.1 hypothetical protein NGM07_22600 [Halorussus vallis]USZ78001.1 hypothetical protein NGM07_20270 [Halorussus vallis]